MHNISSGLVKTKPTPSVPTFDQKQEEANVADLALEEGPIKLQTLNAWTVWFHGSLGCAWVLVFRAQAGRFLGTWFILIVRWSEPSELETFLLTRPNAVSKTLLRWAESNLVIVLVLLQVSFSPFRRLMSQLIHLNRCLWWKQTKHNVFSPCSFKLNRFTSKVSSEGQIVLEIKGFWQEIS